MSLSSIIKKNCQTCGAIAIEKSRLDLGSSKLISLECGHTTFEEVISSANYEFMTSDGRSLMPFQIETVQQLEACNARGLVAHEQGLGKTFIAASLIRLHAGELLPAAIATKTTLKKQWMFELYKITGSDKIQIINSSKEFALPGFDFYIITYDIIKNENVFNMINLKTLIVDECQAIKNHLSGRAKAIQRIG